MTPRALPTEAILNASAHMLRPLVRLLIRVGVTFPVLAERLRMLFVEVAVADLDQESARTDSRVSLLTGIHRKEIRRLRELAADAPHTLTEPAAVTLTGEIIARWLGSVREAQNGTETLSLPRVSEQGLSFDSLVRSVTKDLRPRAILDEWISQGLVVLDPDDRVLLNVTAFIPPPGAEAQLFYFGRNLHDHIAAASANIVAQDEAPFPDVSVHYDRLSIPAAAALEAVARAGATRLLRDINRRALAIVSEDEESSSGNGNRRVNLGIYLYVEDEPPLEPAP